MNKTTTEMFDNDLAYVTMVRNNKKYVVILEKNKYEEIRKIGCLDIQIQRKNINKKCEKINIKFNKKYQEIYKIKSTSLGR